MAKTAISKSSETFAVGQVVADGYGSYGQKILNRIFVDAVGEYRWLVQEVRIKENKATPAGDGKLLALRSTRDLREYDFTWTPDVITIKKGDVLKDEAGKFYAAESSTKVWSLSDGTWSSVGNEGTEITWGGSRKKLTPVKTIGGNSFSDYLG